jgi:hypothetical protein
MAFDPAEPRDPHGKWIKIAKNLKVFSGVHASEATKHALQELPKGGHGNLITLNKGVQIRRHQSGGFSVKIGGEARHYSSHEDAAKAVVDKKHNDAGKMTKSAAAPSTASKAVHSPQSLWEKGILTAEEFYQDTGKYPAGHEPVKPSGPMKITDLKPGDVYEYLGSQWKLGTNVKTPSGSHLTITNVATGEKKSIFAFPTQVVQKVDPKDVSKPKVMPKLKALEIPAGALQGQGAWSAVQEIMPPDHETRKAIASYTGIGYIQVNQGLRKGLLNSTVADMVAKLDKAFQHSVPTKDEIVVYRGFSSADSILGVPGSHVGGVFIDNGYISTSTKNSTAASFGGSGTLVHIILPSGSRVVKPGSISGHSSEMEIILNRGSRFQIVQDRVTGQGGINSGSKREVVLRLIS